MKRYLDNRSRSIDQMIDRTKSRLKAPLIQKPPAKTVSRRRCLENVYHNEPHGAERRRRPPLAATTRV